MNVQQLDVVCSPTELPAVLTDADHALCMVIDVIRATTSLTLMGERGITSVQIAPDAIAAQVMAHHHNEALLAGEVRGQRPFGFDLGNSPSEIQSHPALYKKNIIFVTTNGTKTINICRNLGASGIVAAALRNALALASYALDQPDSVPLVLACAGRVDRSAADDLLTAGIITHLIIEQAGYRGRTIELTEGARLALHFAQTTPDVLTSLQTSAAGQAVIALGLGDDLIYCAATSVTSVIPIADMRTEHTVFHFVRNV